MSCAVVALIFGLLVPAFAQNASLVVRVTDPDRAAVANAPIVLAHLSGEQRTGLTRTDGTFEFTRLATGEYRIEVVAPGFALYSANVTLGSGPRTVEIGRAHV